MGGHRADDGAVGRSYVHRERGCSRRHTQSLGHVESLLGIVATLRRRAAGGSTVGREDCDLGVGGLFDVGVVGLQIGEIGADIFEEAEVLGRTSQQRGSVVGGAHVAAQERSSRTGTGGGVADHGIRRNAVTLCIVQAVYDHRVRNRIVVETGNMPQSERQVGGGFAIRTIEGSVLGGVLVDHHAHMEGRLDGRNRALDLHIHAVARTADHCEPVRLNILNDCIIILLRGAEFFGEF